MEITTAFVFRLTNGLWILSKVDKRGIVATNSRQWVKPVIKHKYLVHNDLVNQ